MRAGLTSLAAGLIAAAFAASAAYAFTVENKDGANGFAVPRFDLEEQAKNFRKSGSTEAKSGTAGVYDTPLGKFQFGVTQGPASNFGMFNSGMFNSGLGPAPRNTRQDFERMVTPENLR